MVFLVLVDRQLCTGLWLEAEQVQADLFWGL